MGGRSDPHCHVRADLRLEDFDDRVCSRLGARGAIRRRPVRNEEQDQLGRVRRVGNGVHTVQPYAVTLGGQADELDLLVLAC